MKTKTITRLSTALLLCILAVTAFSCQGGKKGPMNFSVNGVTYSAAQAENDTLDLLTLSTEFPAEICLARAGRHGRIAVDGIALKGGKASVPVPRIAKDAFLTLTREKDGKRDTLYLRTLHAAVPDVTAEGKAVSPGDFYLSYVYLRLVQKFDNNGNLLFYRFEPYKIQGKDDSTGWWDFKKHTVDGKTFYSYHAPDPAFANLKFAGYNPGMRVILDEHYRPVKSIHLLESRDGFVRAGDPIDGHDFYLFDPDHYIVSSYIERDGVYAAYLQEVQHGAVIFDWWSTNHAEMAGWLDPVFAETAGMDYVHFNSIDVLPDGNWLCSFRHVSSVLKIDRADGTGAILQRLAGADNDGSFAFHGQHFARYHQEDNTLTLFNNGNGTGATQILRFDAETGKCTVLKDDGYYAQACGALTFSGDNMVVGWGIPGLANPSDRLLTEFDASGTTVFSLTRKQPDAPLNSVLASYRSVKCD